MGFFFGSTATIHIQAMTISSLDYYNQLLFFFSKFFFIYFYELEANYFTVL